MFSGSVMNGAGSGTFHLEKLNDARKSGKPVFRIYFR